jgi:hypothetical protein
VVFPKVRDCLPSFGAESSVLQFATQNYRYRTIILPVLYGPETWSLSLRAERRLRGFENTVLRIFRPKRDKVRGERRKLHNEKLNNLLSSPNITGMIK